MQVRRRGERSEVATAAGAQGGGPQHRHRRAPPSAHARYLPLPPDADEDSWRSWVRIRVFPASGLAVRSTVLAREYPLAPGLEAIGAIIRA